MRTIIQLSKRHLLMFFRSKSDVFFSFLSVLIVLGLYIFFLGDMTINNVKAIIGQDVEGVDALIHAWLFAGLAAISTMTLSIGALTRMVIDKQRKVFHDFLVAPIQRHELFFSYIVATFFIVMMISTVVLIIGQGVLLNSGGAWFSIQQWLKIFGLLVLTALSSTMMMLFIISFVETESVISFVASVVGTLIGFVTGAYLPLGILPVGVQIFSNLLPVSHGAALLRQALMEPSFEIVFSGAPEQVITSYKQFQGVELYLSDYRLTEPMMLFFLVATTVLFVILNFVRFKQMKT